jgi:HPt (histidine-containing phosphotransfer) domain-containing protein
MSPIDAELAGLVTELAAKFLHRSVGEWDELRALRESFLALEKATLDRFERWVHRLHGTAATLGLTGLSEEAGEIELALVGEGAPDLTFADAAELWTRLQSLADSLLARKGSFDA